MVLTNNGQPWAKLVREQTVPLLKPRVPGLGKGMITLLVEDDEHLDGFAEYIS